MSDSEEHRSRTESIHSIGASATESPSGEKLPQTASKGIGFSSILHGLVFISFVSRV